MDCYTVSLHISYLSHLLELEFHNNWFKRNHKHGRQTANSKYCWDLLNDLIKAFHPYVLYIYMYQKTKNVYDDKYMRLHKL